MKRYLAIVTVVIWLLIGFVSVGFAADIALEWKAVSNADGYRLQMSTDTGTTWTDPGVDCGNVTTFTLLGVPDTGIVMFRVVAYNAVGEAIKTESGAWYNGDWMPLQPAGGLGVQ